MTTLMSPNPKDRITVALLNNYIGGTGSQIVYLTFLPLMELNNKGYINAPMSTVFTIIAFVATSLGAISNIAMAIGCRERIILQPDPAPITKSIFISSKTSMHAETSWQTSPSAGGVPAVMPGTLSLRWRFSAA